MGNKKTPEAASDPTFLELEFYDPYFEAAKVFALQHPGWVVAGLAALIFGLAYWARSRDEGQWEFLSRYKTVFGFEWREDRRRLAAWLPLTVKQFVPMAVAAGLALNAAAYYFAAPLLDVPGVALILAALVVPWARGRNTLQTRTFYIDQLFTIAQACLRYKASADRVKEQYIQVLEWDEVTLCTPSQVQVMYPASAPVAKEEFKGEFEIQFTAQAVDGVLWDFDWDPPNNRVTCVAQPPLPTMAYLPFPTLGQFEEGEFPLGVGIDGQPVTWSCQSAPHKVVCGLSGGGKSVLQRNILIHALSSPSVSTILIDPKRVEMTPYKDADGVIKYAVTEEAMNEALEFALEEMSNRYAVMEQAGVAFYKRLPDPPNTLLVMIDEAASLLMEVGDKEIDTMKRRNKVIVGRLAREGRAAGVHIVLATQRPDASWLGGDTRSTIEARVAMGKMNTTTSMMVLNNTLATLTPGIKGRGIYFDGNTNHKMQTYFFDEGDIAPAIPLINRLHAGEDPEKIRALMGDVQPADVPDVPPEASSVAGKVKAWARTVAERTRETARQDEREED